MQANKRSIDIVNEVLELCLLAMPVSAFLISLYKQYQQRGSLSKKQLLGLHGKASDIKDFPVSKLATLEALIKKMPNRYKSELPVELKPLYEKDDASAILIEEILAKFPEHKRVIFFQSKIKSNQPLNNVELDELKRFHSFLMKK
jgi:hypothetical protein